MTRLEQLFVEEKFHPLDTEVPPLTELLAIPLKKELKKKRKRQTGTYIIYECNTMWCT